MAEISYGGQAVIEGVMIRSPRYVSVACRLPQPDGSLGGPQTAIDIHTEPVRSPFTKRPWLRRIPLLRGMVALFEMLNMGLRALERSANLQLVTQLVAAIAVALTVDPDPAETDESVAEGGEAPTTDKNAGQLNGPMLWGTMAVAFGIGLCVFVFLPNWLADLIGRWTGADGHFALNLYEGIIRMIFFVGYVGGIGLMPDIRRVFQYHGAEHKAVNGYEAGREPTVENVAEMSVIHPRCGTNFAFLVILMSLVIFMFLPWTESIWPRLGMRLLAMPVVAGIGFEIIRFVGAHRDVDWLQALIWPGLALQRLTTREPAPDMIEVALASFGAVRHAEETDALTVEQRPGSAAGVLGETL